MTHETPPPKPETPGTVSPPGAPPATPTPPRPAQTFIPDDVRAALGPNFVYDHPLAAAAAALGHSRLAVATDDAIYALGQELEQTLDTERIETHADSATVLATQSRIIDALFNRYIQETISPAGPMEPAHLDMILRLQRNCMLSIDRLKHHMAKKRQAENFRKAK